MSFAKKAVKKVFKPIKKVVKKVFKPALITGGILLTGGLATAGFGAFAGVGGVGGFLNAVGTTMAAGFQGLTGAIGLSGGLTGATAAATGAIPGSTLFSGALAQGLGLSAGPSLASTLGQLGPAGAAATSAVGATVPGFAGARAARGFGGALSGFLGGDIGKLALLSGIQSGVGAFLQSKEADRERKRVKRRNFFGGPQVGGPSESGIAFPSFSPGAPAGAPADIDPVALQEQQQAAIAQQAQQPRPLQPPNLIDPRLFQQQQFDPFTGVV